MNFERNIRWLSGGRWPGCVIDSSMDYFGVDYELVWDVVQNRMPALRGQIASIVEA